MLSLRCVHTWCYVSARTQLHQDPEMLLAKLEFLLLLMAAMVKGTEVCVGCLLSRAVGAR